MAEVSIKEVLETAPPTAGESEVPVADGPITEVPVESEQPSNVLDKYGRRFFLTILAVLGVFLLIIMNFALKWGLSFDEIRGYAELLVVTTGLFVGGESLADAASRFGAAVKSGKAEF